MQIGQFQLQIRGKNHSKDSQTLWQGFIVAQESGDIQGSAGHGSDLIIHFESR